MVVSKLKRWSATDRDDVREMVERGHVEHARLVARFRDVLARYAFDGRADLLGSMAHRLNVIERDWFVAAETTFDLPE